MQAITDKNRTIAKALSVTFGGTPKVNRFWDNDRKSFVDILACSNSMQVGITSFATIGLSDFQLYSNGKEYPARVELLGACGSNFLGFDNALASAAFCVINTKQLCFHGAIFTDVLSPYGYADSLPHFLFTQPFLWDTNLKTLQFDGKTITWMLAIPITEAERIYAMTHGFEELESLFQQHQIDIFNLRRHSVI